MNFRRKRPNLASPCRSRLGISTIQNPCGLIIPFGLGIVQLRSVKSAQQNLGIRIQGMAGLQLLQAKLDLLGAGGIEYAGFLQTPLRRRIPTQHQR